MGLIFGSDFHFDCMKVADNKTRQLVIQIADEYPDAEGLIIAGDISSAPYIEQHLQQLASGFPTGFQIYFVLGNHDFYSSSFKLVNEKISKLTKRIPNLHWLQTQSPIKLTWCDIVGVGGWYDAYYGNTNSSVRLNDFYCITDLMHGVSYQDLLIKLCRDEAGRQADILYRQLKQTTSNTIIIVTHIPPYRESTWHEGNISNSEWLPWFSSASTGNTIDRYAVNNPDKKIIVITGHTHSPGIYNRDNITVYTCKGEYGKQHISGIINKDKIIALDNLGKKIENEI